MPSKLPQMAASVALLCLCIRAVALPPGFIEEPVVTGLNQPTCLAFEENGRMWIATQAGQVLWVQPGENATNLLIDLSDEIIDQADLGLNGLAIDPAFQTNGYIYLFYTVDWEWYSTGGSPDPANLDQRSDSFGRLTRYTVTWDSGFTNVTAGDRTVLIGAQHDNGVPMLSNSHGPGHLLFARDGTLLAAVGDGACYTNHLGLPDIGGSRANPCSDNTGEDKGVLDLKEQVGSYRSQLVDTYNGKILRLDTTNVDPVQGIAGHPSNPYFDPLDPYAPRSKVYALGLRNPHRFAILPGTGSDDPDDGQPGVLFIGDVGWNTWEEVEVCDEPGINFGWPIYEGMFPTADYPDYEVENLDAPNPLFDGVTCTQQYLFFTDLLIQETLNPPSFPNPCDTGMQIPASFTFMHRRPRLAYKHFFNETYAPIFDGKGNAAVIDLNEAAAPIEGDSFNGRAPIAGVFYTGTRFPPEYQNSYFFCDAFGKGQVGQELGWIRNLTLDAEHNITAVRNIKTGGIDTTPVAMAVPPDQSAVYYLHHSRFSGAGTGEVRRLSYDCNGNGVSDFIDVSNGMSLDFNANGYPDECENLADINNDGTVNVLDLLLMLGAWGPCPGGCGGDLNGDEVVNVLDLLLMLGAWG